MEPSAADGIALLQWAGHELLLLAAVGILLLGLEDLGFDALWLARDRRTDRAPGAARPVEGPLAIFVPAWDEAAVLPATLARMLNVWPDADIRIYVGCYSNDGATFLAISRLVARNPRLRLVLAPYGGPSSKADNLNQMWQALASDEVAEGRRFAGVVLHDAEDVVHPDEIELFRRYLPTSAMVQIPVEPLLQRGDPMVAAHYADEFAEAHGKEMVLRDALRAALPGAGVGCAFSRHALSLLALNRPDGPFRADSLTEDYEAALILGASGANCRFVAVRGRDGMRIATRSAFPARLDHAVRQKSRWIAGIALAGWDRLDWSGQAIADMAPTADRPPSWHTRWMLWRDRRAPLSALIILCAYLALVFTAVDQAGQMLGGWVAATIDPLLQTIVVFNALLLSWRLGMRAWFVARIYGWRQGLAAVPRAFVGNIIHMLAARRALLLYVRQLRSQKLLWEKTDHRHIAAGQLAEPAP